MKFLIIDDVIIILVKDRFERLFVMVFIKLMNKNFIILFDIDYNFLVYKVRLLVLIFIYIVFCLLIYINFVKCNCC